MALFNIFQRKKPFDAGHSAELSRSPQGKKKKKVAPKEVKKEIKQAVKKEIKKEAAAVPLKSKKESEAAYRILKFPHVTEKATDLTKFNQYIFNVYEGATKPGIKRAAEDVYGAKVVSVKIVNIHPKKRRLGRVKGWRKGYKKAIVRLAEGQKIEILPR